MKKYWYIGFSIFAFPFLAFHTLWACNRVSYPSVWKVYGNFFFLGIVIIGIPTLIVEALTETAERPAKFCQGVNQRVFQ